MILTHLQRSFRLFRISEDELETCICRFNAQIDLMSYPDGRAQNEHLMMMDLWLAHIVENSIAYNMWHEMDVSMLSSLKNNTIQIPGDPDDYTMSHVFLRKIQSILKDTVTIVDFQFSTDSGPGIAFTIMPEAVDLPTIQEWVGERHYWPDPWWNRSDGSTFDVIPDEDSDLEEKPDILVNLAEFVPNRQPTAPAEIITPNYHLKIISNDTP